MDGVSSLVATCEEIGARYTDGASGTVGTSIEYARYQEYGTRHQSGTPFLRPAAERTSRRMDEFAREGESPEQIVSRALLFAEAQAKQLVPVDTGTLRSSVSGRMD